MSVAVLEAYSGADASERSEFVTIRIADQLLGIPVLTVQDVLGPHKILRIPLAPVAVASPRSRRASFCEMSSGWTASAAIAAPRCAASSSPCGPGGGGLGRQKPFLWQIPNPVSTGWKRILIQMTATAFFGSLSRKSQKIATRKLLGSLDLSLGGLFSSQN